MKAIIVCGPTATGKTDLAIQLAKKFNSVLISADSRQLYKYLPISTNQGDIKNFRNYETTDLSNISDAFQNYTYGQIDGIDCHLANFLKPNQIFNVYDFQQACFRIVEDYNNQNIVPIIVGGTGLYIDSVVRKYHLENGKVDQNIRTELSKLNIEELKKLVQKDVMCNLNESDKYNKERLVRMIEKHGTVNSDSTNFNPSLQQASQINYSEFIFLYPNFEWDKLKTKIRSRVDQMVEKDMFGEVKRFIDAGYPRHSQAITSSGVKDVVRYFDDEISSKECIELIKIKHWQYAKRQRTWFEGKGRGYKLNYVNGIVDCSTILKNFLS
jgi:tRNA dimethylallyltransferase